MPYRKRKDSILIKDKDELQAERKLASTSSFAFFQGGDYWTNPKEQYSYAFSLPDRSYDNKNLIEASSRNLKLLEDWHLNHNLSNDPIFQKFERLKKCLIEGPYHISHVTTTENLVRLNKNPVLYSNECLHQDPNIAFNKTKDGNSKADLWTNNNDFVFFYLDYGNSINRKSRYGNVQLSTDASKTALYEYGMVMMDDIIDNGASMNFGSTTRNLKLDEKTHKIDGRSYTSLQKVGSPREIKYSVETHSHKRNLFRWEIKKGSTTKDLGLNQQLNQTITNSGYDSRHGIFVGKDINLGVSLWVTKEMILVGLRQFDKLLDEGFSENSSEEKRIEAVNQILKAVIRPQAMISKSVSVNNFDINTNITCNMSNQCGREAILNLLSRKKNLD